MLLSPQVAAWGTWPYDVARYCDFGRVGVLSFFIISGFVIPPSLRGPRGPGLRKFMIRRLLRLYPAYWLAVILGYLGVQKLAFGKVWAWTPLLANFTMVQGALGFDSVMGHFWTLEMEVIFYAICVIGFVCGLLLRSRWAALVTFVCGAFAFLGFQGKLHSFEIPYEIFYRVYFLGFMHWGALYRAWQEAGRRRDWRLAWLVGLMALLLAHPVLSLLDHFPGGDPGDIRFAVSHLLGVAVFLVGAELVRISWVPVVYLGEVSYSLYLFHPVIFHVGNWFLHWPSTPVWLRELPLLLYVLIYMALSIGFAILVYRWVEKPAIVLAHHLTRTPMPVPVDEPPPGEVDGVNVSSEAERL